MIKLSDYVSHTGYHGYLGNKLLQNIGISVLSKKYNLFPSYDVPVESDILKFNLYYGNQKIEKCKEYHDTDLNYLLTNQKELEHGIIFNGYFQHKSLLLGCRHLVDEIITKREIVRKDTVFVHVRLGDAEIVNHGIDYYRAMLNSISFKEGIISSDSPNHDIVKKLSQEYSLNNFYSSPIDTILVGSECEHRVLSGGTFSWWIGFLGNNNNVYCRREPKFHGDIFVYPEWNYF